MRHRMLRTRLIPLLTLALLLPGSAAWGERVRVTAKRLTVRAKPSTKAKRLGAVVKGSVHEVQKRQGGWVAIPFANKTGWVFGRWVQPTTGARPAPRQGGDGADATRTVRATRLNVRSKASIKAKRKFRLRRGTRVTLKETRGVWCHIAHRARRGWVMCRYLVAGELPPPRRRPRKKPRRVKKRP